VRTKPIKVSEIAYHRNGISGEGFYAVTFTCPEEGDMVATVFPEPGCCAVLKLSLLPVVTFGINSWRGDHFEGEIRKAIRNKEAAERRATKRALAGEVSR
jgi:hypothetical protein